MPRQNQNHESRDLTQMTVDVCLHKPTAKGLEQYSDTVVCEQPMEIQVNGRSLSVMMRTPGDDYELAVGFLLTEQIVDSWEDIEGVHHCTQAPDPDAVDNIVKVSLRSGLEIDFDKLSRHFFGSSSCGVCGKAALEQLMVNRVPLADTTTIEAKSLDSMMDVLQRTQSVFKRTGGLHAAALFDATGKHLVTREDVGRHNAVDKVIGWAYRLGYVSLAGTSLLVSGRVSFEIIQKALMARIPIIAAVSAPSSLAIQLSKETNQTLLGFVREGLFNVYSGHQRIQL